MPNHPPAPVQDLVAVLGPVPSADDCKALKDKHKITTRQHKSGAKNLKDTESHHILQNAAVKKIIPYKEAMAVLLPIGVHQSVNRSQIARNCPGPAPTSLGKLVVNARDDLAKAFAKPKPDGKGMKPDEAKKLANCVTKEAIDRGQEVNDNKLGPNTKVKQPKGCVGTETLVLLDDGTRSRAGDVTVGTALWAGGTVEAIGGCTATMIEIVTARGSFVVSDRHRVRLSSSVLRTAGRISPGDLLSSAGGPVAVLDVRERPYAERALAIVVDDGDLFVGDEGVCVEGRGVAWRHPPSRQQKGRGSNAAESKKEEGA